MASKSPLPTLRVTGMKRFNDAFVGGFRSASSSIRMVLVLYVSNLVIALPLALMFRGIMTSAIGNSMLTDRLLAGFDATVYAGFLRNGSKGLGALGSAVGWGAALSMVLTTVLDGGILGQLSSGGRRFTLASFFGDCGRYLWRYLRLSLIFAPVLVIVFLGSTALFGSIYDAVDRSAVSEVDVIRARILILAATLFLVGLVVLMSDYARVETVRSDARSMFRVSWIAVKFVFRRFFSVVGLQLAFLVVSLCVIAAYLLAENPMNVSTGAGILALLVAQQVTIVLRMFIRVATFAGERHLYLSLVAPQSASFPEVLARSAPALPVALPVPSGTPVPASLPTPAGPPLAAEPDVVPVPRTPRQPRARMKARPRTRSKGKISKLPATGRRAVRRKERS